MKFMTVVTTNNPEKAGAPPPALFEAINELGAATGAALKDTGGMKDSGTVRLEGGKILVDGPFAEAKEAVGGYAIYELPTYEAVIDYCKQFLELHRKHWPAWDGTVTVQELVSFMPPQA